MDDKEMILFTAKQKNYDTKIYYELDSEIEDEIKSIIKNRNQNEIIVEIAPEDLTYLNQKIEKLETQTITDTEGNLDFIRKMILETFFSFKIFTELDKKNIANKLINDEIRENLCNFDAILNSYIEAASGDFTNYDKYIKNNNLTLFSIGNVLPKIATDIHLFGIEYLNAFNCQKLQKIINSVIAWRGPKYRMHLYTKEANLLTYYADDDALIENVHDYTYVRYNKNQKIKINTKK